MEIRHPGHEGPNSEIQQEKVRHRSDEGPNSEIQQEKVLHPGYEGPNSANPARKMSIIRVMKDKIRQSAKGNVLHFLDSPSALSIYVTV
ncbi:hypothetical protein [Peribacillus sp. Hz7]|uniref:hypothetical protein n=1 Tax=Peribacillus sp. Hz7 TaxID=3344873 RepID=UPI0035CC6CDC